MFDDLLNKPYKAHGRGPEAYDCYGLVLECCRRAGTPLRDVWYEKDSVPAEDANDYISAGLNVRRIDRPNAGCLAEMEYNGHLHIGYMIDRDTVLHTTSHGVHTAGISLMRVCGFYEVTDENNSLQKNK